MSSSKHSPFQYVSSMGARIVIDTIFHPLEYAKFLIQIGHEPLPPFPTKTLLGQPALGLPNCFKYVQYIKNVDGWQGCYRGCLPKAIGRTLGSIASTSAISHFELDKTSELTEDMELSDEEKLTLLRISLIKNIIGRTCLVVVSHPFYVISNRMMAQFVGGEETYNGLFSSVVEIFRHEGISGFFRGIFPRWFMEMASIGVSSILIYTINNYLISDRELKSFTAPPVNVITSSLVYQFNVVSACMSVNNCGLMAGVPPNMPIYKSWWSCRQHLSSLGQLGRGSTPICRYFVEPPAGVKAVASY